MTAFPFPAQVPHPAGRRSASRAPIDRESGITLDFCIYQPRDIELLLQSPHFAGYFGNRKLVHCTAFRFLHREFWLRALHFFPGRTRVGAELPRPQTQSRLKAHSLSPAIGPASVPRRAAPRGTSSRRKRGGPHGERGATQGPHSTPAQNTEAGYRTPLLVLPRRSPGCTCCAR